MSVDDLKRAGYSAKALLAAGISPEALKQAGYTTSEIEAAQSNGLSAARAKELLQSGMSVDDLKRAGYSAKALLAAGISPEALKQAGYTASEVEAALKGTSMDGADANLDQQLLSQIQSTLSGQNSTQDQQLQALNQQQAALLKTQKDQQKIDDRASAMSGQASALLQGWSTTRTQTVQEAPFSKEAPSLANRLESMKSGQNLQASGDVIKAGSIVFGVMDTALNSDQPGPVLATIVQGPLNGAKLIGSFTRTDDRMLISFNRISIPGIKNSVPTSIVAIDSNTARTAVASSVDKHYLLRYGTLFASSFLEGLSQAISSSGTQLSVGAADAGAGNGWKVVKDNLSPTGKALVALGTVGSRFSNALQPVFSTPPTVRVNSGDGIGLLFMSDFSVPVA